MFLAATWTWWYVNLAPHTTPTSHNGFGWGLIHGALLLPNFIYSWFDDRATIYQSPNVHFAYNLGFVIAILVIYGGSARFSRR